MQYGGGNNKENIAWQTGIELGNLPEAQLYNLREDPAERHNVAAEYPEKVREMGRRLAEIRAAGRSRP